MFATAVADPGGVRLNPLPKSFILCIRETPKQILLQTVKTKDEMAHNPALHQGLHCLLR